MFTGIITALGVITTIKSLQEGLRLTVTAPVSWLHDVKIGDSIAHNGVCLTVIQKSKQRYAVDVSGETLRCTCGLTEKGAPVNLEKALRLQDVLGGHLVSGHVDGVGEVLEFSAVGASHQLVIKAPKKLAKFIAKKGSITVNGVSLTVNAVQGRQFAMNIIPHTLTATTFAHLQRGGQVNLEIDVIARYAERLLRA